MKLFPSPADSMPALANVPKDQRRELVSNTEAYLLRHDRRCLGAFMAFHGMILAVLIAMPLVYDAANGTGFFATMFYPTLAVTVTVILAMMHRKMLDRRINDLLLKRQREDRARQP